MVLVSGATGFLGSYIVCDLLRQNKKVRALKRSSSTLAEFEFIAGVKNIAAAQLQNLEWFTADILDLGELETAFVGVDEVIHSAGIVSFLKRDKEMMMQVNMEGTANMVNLALVNGVKKFAYISSIAAIGRSTDTSEINEKSKWEGSNRNTAYAESKYAGEMEVWRGIHEGLNAVIVNPGIIIGAGDFTKGSGKMFETANHGIRFYTPGISGFVDVRDVSQCILQLMDQNISGERFILVSENYEFKKFYDEAAACFNKPAPKYNTPSWMAAMGYRALALLSMITGKPPLLTKETTQAAYQKYFYDNSKIKSALHFEFIPVKETIRWACGWYDPTLNPSSEGERRLA
jgi:dihydroflavonol-4-reductase